MGISKKLVLTLCLQLSLFALAKNPYPTIKEIDPIEWRFSTTEEVVAIGDIHGDLEALLAILYKRGFIDKKGHWSGDARQLVLSGDLVSGKRYSRYIIDFLMRLESEAESATGKVHVLVGNKEVEATKEKKKKNSLSKKERKGFENVPHLQDNNPVNAFRYDTPHAKWLREKNFLVQINDQIYVHAGFDPLWAEKNSGGEINSTARAWIRYFQGVGEKPPKKTFWIVDPREWKKGSGPAYTRIFKPRTRKGEYVDKKHATSPSLKSLRSVLKKFFARYVIVGHSPVEKKVMKRHPYYGKDVRIIDTRISQRGAGRLSSLRVREGEFKDQFADRNKRSRKLLKRVLKDLSPSEKTGGGEKPQNGCLVVYVNHFGEIIDRNGL